MSILNEKSAPEMADKYQECGKESDQIQPKKVSFLSRKIILGFKEIGYALKRVCLFICMNDGFCRLQDRSRVWGQVFDNNAICPDPGVVADRDFADYFGAGTDKDVVADYGSSLILAFFRCQASDGYLLKDHYVFTDPGCVGDMNTVQSMGQDRWSGKKGFLSDIRCVPLQITCIQNGCDPPPSSTCSAGSSRNLPGSDVVHPLLILEIPCDGFLDPFFELQRGLPAQFVLELRGVDGVSQIVTGTVRNECDQVVRGAFWGAQQPVDRLDDHPHKVDVAPLVETADVIRVGCPAAVEDLVDGPGVVLDIEPVADILAPAVDG